MIEFVRDKAKNFEQSGRCQLVKWRVYFGELVFERPVYTRGVTTCMQSIRPIVVSSRPQWYPHRGSPKTRSQIAAVRSRS